jgi:hypothetical protein
MAGCGNPISYRAMSSQVIRFIGFIEVFHGRPKLARQFAEDP